MSLVLLTTSEPWKLSDIAANWSSRGGQIVSMTWFFIGLGALGLGLGAIWFVRWRRLRREHPGGAIIFRQVARAAGLNASDRHLLSRIAVGGTLPSPLTLLLSSATFKHHAQNYIHALPAKRRGAVQQQVKAVGEVVFDS